MTPEKTPPEKMRLDKWLWAARFYKTRSLATQSIEQGRVKLNDERTKPSRDIKPGVRLEIHAGDAVWTLTVRMLSMQRGPASEAQQLYEEDADSIARRQQCAADRKLSVSPAAGIRGRPTKRDRRQIHRFTDP